MDRARRAVAGYAEGTETLGSMCLALLEAVDGWDPDELRDALAPYPEALDGVRDQLALVLATPQGGFFFCESVCVVDSVAYAANLRERVARVNRLRPVIAAALERL